MQMSNGDRWNRAIDIATVAASKSGSLSVINIDSGNPSSQPERNMLSLTQFCLQTSFQILSLDWHLFLFLLVNSIIVFCSTIYITISKQLLLFLDNRNALLSALRYSHLHTAFHVSLSRISYFMSFLRKTMHHVYVVWLYQRRTNVYVVWTYGRT